MSFDIRPRSVAPATPRQRRTYGLTHQYNTARPHSGLGYRAPMEVLTIIAAPALELVRHIFFKEHQPLIYQGTRVLRQLQKMELAVARDDIVRALDDLAGGVLSLEQFATLIARS